ncbi:hypothetical protein KAU11_11460 [Candidatus Babeliales bacterium]|nr:hypothetical protein [Candidatus Babeliales bacterium]
MAAEWIIHKNVRGEYEEDRRNIKNKLHQEAFTYEMMFLPMLDLAKYETMMIKKKKE